MQEISGLFGHTPRTINRYVNIYRIIKAHPSFNIDSDLTENEYRAVMLGLGIVVGHPNYSETFIREISKSKNVTLEEFLHENYLPQELINSIRGSVRQQLLESVTSAMIRKNLDLLARFSFRPIQLEGI
jgi:hypothetical protein